MIKSNTRYLFIILLAGILYGCSSTRRLQQPSTAINQPVETSSTQILAQSVNRADDIQSLNAKVSYTLQLPGKGEQSLSGQLRIQHGRGIQLSGTFILGIEVFRILFTPQDMMLINRVNRTYVISSYSEVSERLGTPVDYSSIEALFLNKVFMVGQQKLTEADMRRFTASQQNGDWTFSRVMPTIRYTYQFEPLTLRLTRTMLQNGAATDRIVWDYEQFSENQFPTQMNIQVGHNDKEAHLQIQFDRIDFNTPIEWNNPISSRYRRVSIEEALKILKQP